MLTVLMSMGMLVSLSTNVSSTFATKYLQESKPRLHNQQTKRKEHKKIFKEKFVPTLPPYKPYKCEPKGKLASTAVTSTLTKNRNQQAQAVRAIENLPFINIIRESEEEQIGTYVSETSESSLAPTPSPSSQSFESMQEEPEDKTPAAITPGSNPESNEIIHISTANDLIQVSKRVIAESGLAGKTIVLDNDINLSNIDPYSNAEQYYLLGNDSIPFCGTFDGQNHTITINIKSAISWRTVALFPMINNATIKNLRVNGFVESHGVGAAGIVGHSFGISRIENCLNTATVIADGLYSGGIVGNASDNLTVFRCVNIGEIKNLLNAGGLAGICTKNAQIIDCGNAGTVFSSRNAPGGIAGKVESNAVVKECKNMGHIKSEKFYPACIAGSLSDNAQMLDCECCARNHETKIPDGPRGDAIRENFIFVQDPDWPEHIYSWIDKK